LHVTDAVCTAANTGIAAAAGIVADTVASASTDGGNYIYLFNVLPESSVTFANNLFESAVH
jgi:hypothetical protein